MIRRWGPGCGCVVPVDHGAAVVRAVAEAFSAVDPMDLLWAGCPEDEYSPEINDLAERLLDGEALDLRLVAGVLMTWFEQDSGSERLYMEIKRRVDLLPPFR